MITKTKNYFNHARTVKFNYVTILLIISYPLKLITNFCFSKIYCQFKVASKLLFIAILLEIGASSCKKDEIIINTSKKENVKEILLAEVKTQNLNSLSFCVVKKDSLLWTDALGYSDIKNNKLATPETRYLIASISKLITAVSVFKLIEEGKINLDEDINTYLPFKVKNPHFPNNKITVKMLLNHSSSVSDSYANNFNFYSWNEDSPIPLDIFIRDFFEESTQFCSTKNFYNYTPGSLGNYSNIGYALLGYIVEVVSKQPFDLYSKNNIILPLGMTKTEWRLKNTPLDELAIPYSLTINTNKPHFTFPDYPNGGLRTTVIDLSKILRMLIMKGQYNGVQILNSNTVELMEKHTITFSVGPEKLELGLGMYSTDIKGKSLLGHGGNEQGTSTGMHYDPVTQVGVIVFTNTTAANLNQSIYSLYKFGTQQ